MKYSLGLFFVASIAFIPNHAHAGFQFTAPVEQATPALTPIPSISSSQMPSAPTVKVQSTPVQNITPQTQPRSPVANASPVPITQNRAPQSIANENTLAVGFGKNLPLVTALGQVIPDGYTYVMDDNIATGKTVSWNGGQPWPTVLNNMTRDLGLHAQINEKIVRITHHESQKSEPVKIASAQQYSNPNIAYDAPQSIMPAPQQHVPQPIATNSPTNILSSELPNQSVQIKTTEKPIEQNKSIVPDVTIGQWIAQNGGSLKTVLESWSNIEGVDLFWSADYDYKLAGDVNITGNYEEAVKELLSGFSEARPKPLGRLHPNLPHGPAVLVIETTESE